MSKKRQIVNIINFIRAYDPRNVTKEMLLEVVREQIALADAHGLKTTFMIQYDAMLDKDFTDLLLPLDPVRYEIGLWHELCEAEATACGLPWTGDYPWDWHCHCDFPVGYSKEGREALADEAFRLFKEVFGYYPKVFGSWFFDSHTLRYIAEKYGLDACCNCKEQYGTDGYTLWGSYYGQG